MVHNREEDFARPTAPLGQFKEDTNIFGGRDLREQGSWLAFNAKTQNLAFLTNRFSWSMMKNRILAKFGIGKVGGEISRGQLISDFVGSDFFEKFPQNEAKSTSVQYGHAVFGNRDKFGPFNLLVANFREMEFVFQSNFDRFPPVSLRDGFHSFCNHSSFEAPTPKQIYGLNRFKTLVKEAQSIDEDEQKAQDNQEIATNNQINKIDPQKAKQIEKSLISNIHELMEDRSKHLSAHFLPFPQEASIFIPPYRNYLFSHTRGTRTSTVLILNKNNELTISETTYSPNPEEQPPINNLVHINL